MNSQSTMNVFRTRNKIWKDRTAKIFKLEIFFFLSWPKLWLYAFKIKFWSEIMLWPIKQFYSFFYSYYVSVKRRVAALHLWNRRRHCRCRRHQRCWSCRRYPHFPGNELATGQKLPRWHPFTFLILKVFLKFWAMDSFLLCFVCSVRSICRSTFKFIFSS